MHAALQTGGHSPKPECGLASTSQLKPIPYCVPNSGTLPSSLPKGKKRERVDHGCEPTKRERFSKPEDSDLCHFKPEANLKSEIIKIAGKGGGLVDMEGVEKLLQLVTPEKSDRKIDLTSRSLLAGVISATENPDCLSHFVQFKGLLVLDEWIQDVHKGKISSSRYSDDDFLLVLLRALDNLPVDLNALQTCNIGKSVNHLRTHKNIEIQKKARVLVDTWKKRVKAEFNNQDVKQGPPPAVQWPSRTTGSHSLDSGPKSSVTQASVYRNTPVKPVHGDTMKSTSAGLTRCASSVSLPNFKDSQSRSGPLIDRQCTIKDENTCGSSQYTNNMSGVNDHMKVASTAMKEDQRNSSKNGHRASKLVNDLPTSGIQRETHVLSRSSSPHQNISSGTVDEKACEVATTSANESCPKLIVKIPNCTQGLTISPYEDSSLAYTHSPFHVTVESHGQLDHCSKDTNNTHGTNVASDVNTESWQSNDFKDVFTGSDEGDGPLAPAGDDCCTSGNDAEKATNPSQATSLPFENDCNRVTTPELSSGSKIVADGSVQIYGVSTDPPTVDDSGMDLLASVAGEMQSAGHCNSPFPKADVVCVDSSFMDTRNESEEKPINSNEPSCFSESEMLPETKKNLVEGKSDIGGIMVVDSVTVMCPSCVTEIIENGECKKCKEILIVDISAASDGGTTESILNLTVSLSEEGRVENLSSLAQEEECVRGKAKMGDEIDSRSSDSIVNPCAGLENRDLCPLPSKPSGNMVDLVEENLENKENDRLCSGGSVSGIRLSKHVDSKLSSVEVDETDECASSTAVVSSFSDSSGSDTDSKPGFDLNEGIMAEGGRSGDVNGSGLPGCSNSFKMVTSFPLSFPPISVCISSPITVAAAAKGPFVPLDDLMKSRSEPGWKGSAATSAFRPAEPRRATETPQSGICEQSRPMLDFDLNIPDEASFEEPIFRTPCDPSTSVNNSYSSHDLPTSRSAVGFDLDLNQADVAAEVTPSSTPCCSRLQLFPPYPSSTRHSDDACCRGKFDLNNGPSIDDSSTISPFFCRNLRSGSSSQEPTSCIKMNSPESGSFTSWFPSGGNTRPTISLPTLFSDRGDPPFPPIIATSVHPRILTASSGGGHFPSDAYHVPVMPSSHAISFQASPFQYPLFPFGATLPLPSATFSVGSAPYGDSSSSGRAVPFHAIQTQILTHPSVISPHFQRPYAPRIPDGCSTSPIDGGRWWSGHALDLNDGPLGPEMEGRNEVIPAVLRQQHPVSSSVEEHATRMYQMASGALKKRDSEGGWDISYRLPSCH